MADDIVECPECNTQNDVEGHRTAREQFPERAGKCPSCGTDLGDLVFADGDSATGAAD